MKKFKIIITYELVFILILGSLCFFKTKDYLAFSMNSWGLSFKDPSNPNPNVSKDELLKYNAYYQGDTTSNFLYLTFDCGYEAGYTNSILDTLKKYDIKATFFVVGHYLKSASDIVLRMINEGHNVCNHTYSHPNMSKINNETLVKEINKLEDAFNLLTNSKLIKYYRPPAGVYSYEQLEVIKKLGYKTIFWSVAYKDYDKNNQYSENKALELLSKRTHKGAIILLHNTSKTNALVLDNYLEKMISEKYLFKLIDF